MKKLNPGKLYKISAATKPFAKRHSGQRFYQKFFPAVTAYRTNNVHFSEGMTEIPHQSIIMFIEDAKSENKERFYGQHRWSWKVIWMNEILYIPRSSNIRFDICRPKSNTNTNGNFVAGETLHSTS
jgi:hypothetical protein